MEKWKVNEKLLLAGFFPCPEYCRVDEIAPYKLQMGQRTGTLI